MAHLYKSPEQNTSRMIRPVDQTYQPKLSGTLAHGNGVVSFGAVPAGTVLGRITSSGKFRPVGKAAIASAVSASASVPVDNAQNFYQGDSVSAISKLGVAGTRTLTASAGSPAAQILVTGRLRDGKAHNVRLIDPSANSQSLRQVVNFDSGGVANIDIYLATGGGGAITSTVAEVIEELNRGVAGTLVFANHVSGGGASSLTAIAVAQVALQGAVVAGGVLSSSNAVVSVNRSTNTITLTTAITAAQGDSLQLGDGSQVAVGIMDKAANTLDVHQSHAIGEAAHRDQNIAWSCTGLYLLDALEGANEYTLADLGAKRIESNIIRL